MMLDEMKLASEKANAQKFQQKDLIVDFVDGKSLSGH